MDNIETTEEVIKAPRRGRPRNVDLPETTSYDEIEVIEEIVENTNNSVESNNAINNTNEIKTTESAKISTEETQEDNNTKGYTAHYLYKKDEEVYLVHFSGKSEEEIFGPIVERYIFRPLKTKVKEIIINDDNTISYRLDLCHGCFNEKLITKTLEECEKLCNLQNARK